MDPDLVQAAVEYLSAGLVIIALAGKMPNALIHRHGLREPMSGTPDGPDDMNVVRWAFTHPETTGIGIVIMAPGVVVDIDGEEGAVQLRDILGTTDPDARAVARTARGLHLWYTHYPPMRSTKLGPKLDLKGEGGYVVAPPSLHPSGVRYEWLRPLVVDGKTVPILELPEQIAQAVALQDRVEDQMKLRPPATAGSLNALVAYVRHLEEGNRNHGLYWAACAARDDGFTRAETEPRLLEAALAAGLERREAVTTIRSAFVRPTAQ